MPLDVTSTGHTLVAVGVSTSYAGSSRSSPTTTKYPTWALCRVAQGFYQHYPCTHGLGLLRTIESGGCYNGEYARRAAGLRRSDATKSVPSQSLIECSRWHKIAKLFSLVRLCARRPEAACLLHRRGNAIGYRFSELRCSRSVAMYLTIHMDGNYFSATHPNFIGVPSTG